MIISMNCQQNPNEAKSTLILLKPENKKWEKNGFLSGISNHYIDTPHFQTVNKVKHCTLMDKVVA